MSSAAATTESRDETPIARRIAAVAAGMDGAYDFFRTRVARSRSLSAALRSAVTAVTAVTARAAASADATSRQSSSRSIASASATSDASSRLR